MIELIHDTKPARKPKYGLNARLIQRMNPSLSGIAVLNSAVIIAKGNAQI